MKKFKLLFLLILFIIGINNVEASSYSVIASNRYPTVGQSINITISGTDVIGAFSVSSSNNAVLLISSSESRKWIENNSETITLKVLKAGTTNITVSPISVSNGSGVDLSLSSKTITITAKNPVPIVKSKNNNLSSLTIADGQLYPVFDKNVLEYSVDLPFDTIKTTINATLEDNTATIIGNGEISVNDGINVLKVFVTASNGDVKTYTINANVLTKNPIEITIKKNKYQVIRKTSEMPEMALYELKTIKIKGEEVPAYYNSKNKITLVALKNNKGNISLYVYDKNDETYALYNEFSFNRVVLYTYNPGKEIKLPTGYKKYTIKIGNKELEVYKIKQTSKYSLIYGMNVETGKTGFYLYDSEEQTLQKYYNEEVKVLKNTLNNYFFIILSLSFSSLLFLGILLFIIIKKRKIKLAK